MIVAEPEKILKDKLKSDFSKNGEIDFHKAANTIFGKCPDKFINSTRIAELKAALKDAKSAIHLKIIWEYAGLTVKKCFIKK